MSDRARGGHDLCHQLPQVVVGLEDDGLARGPVAVLEQVGDPGQGVLGPEVLRVLAQAVEDLLERGNGASRQVVVYEANHDLRELMAEIVAATSSV